ncbi:hypothetical protein NDU88_003536 [Pleurodeles waltl]|uniref:Linker for activation of T-cells family member 2 n=1 Tax=Pleurodeles waltl TaxID=8319 RepID=A0AAV7PH62_PLEWA|nr:hypothetical protein NDU88_003536 [Pleurodeles waltl]
MSWAVEALTPVLWISGGWALTLVALLLVCVNCWQSRGAPIMPRQVHTHQSSALTSQEENNDNDEEDFEEAPAPIPAPPKSQSEGAQRKTQKSVTDADSHGSYVNIQTDYVNVHHIATGSSPVSESLYLEVLPADMQVKERNQTNHSYENVATVDEFKASVDSWSGFDYENVMGPCSLRSQRAWSVWLRAAAIREHDLRPVQKSSHDSEMNCIITRTLQRKTDRVTQHHTGDQGVSPEVLNLTRRLQPLPRGSRCSCRIPLLCAQPAKSEPTRQLQQRCRCVLCSGPPHRGILQASTERHAQHMRSGESVQATSLPVLGSLLKAQCQ